VRRETSPLFNEIRVHMTVLSTVILVTFLFPETVVNLMFGKEYLSIFLLWKYALALIFAIANISPIIFYP
jgi:hypothetical protein